MRGCGCPQNLASRESSPRGHHDPERALKAPSRTTWLSPSAAPKIRFALSGRRRTSVVDIFFLRPPVSLPTPLSLCISSSFVVPSRPFTSLRPGLVVVVSTWSQVSTFRARNPPEEPVLLPAIERKHRECVRSHVGLQVLRVFKGITTIAPQDAWVNYTNPRRKNFAICRGQNKMTKEKSVNREEKETSFI